jgi:hypothetical protein
VRPGAGEERFARWIDGDEWRRQRSLDRLFAEAEGEWAETETPEARPLRVQFQPSLTARYAAHQPAPARCRYEGLSR